jgi:hypothetical protein
MFVSPVPNVVHRIEPRSVVGYLEAEGFFRRVQSDGRSSALAGVPQHSAALRRSKSKPLPRSLVSSAHAHSFRMRVEMRAAGGVGERLLQPAILEEWREDAVSSVRNSSIASRTAPRSSARIALACSGSFSPSSRYRSEVRFERNEVLLSAIEVALDPPLAVGGGYTRARDARSFFLGLSLKLRKRRLQFGIESDVTRTRPIWRARSASAASTSSSSCDSSRCSDDDQPE